MSREYLAAWLRQLGGCDQYTDDVDSLTTAELTRLIILLADDYATAHGQS